jgi:hypothetical protein
MTKFKAAFFTICLLMAWITNVHGQFTPGH